MTDVARQIGTCVVERVIGRGGMGVVYLARDPALDRAVAINAIPAEWAGTPSVWRGSSARRDCLHR